MKNRLIVLSLLAMLGIHVFLFSVPMEQPRINRDYGVSGATSTDNDDIGQFILGAFSNPATPPASLTYNLASVGTYTDFTALGAIPLTRGLPTLARVLQINSGQYNECNLQIFIDYNQNQVWDLPEEAVLGGSTIPNPLTGMITVPMTALTGNTRLRIVLMESGDPSTYPVGTYDWGETEDYTVNITDDVYYYGASFATEVADDDIGQVVIGSFSNPAIPPSPLTYNPLAVEKYTDFTSLGPIQLQAGVSTPVQILQFNSDQFWGCAVQIFIDYNQNLVWDLPEEAVFGGPVDPNQYSGSFLVSETALAGQTRLRIVLMEGDPSAYPVGSYAWGETEDYTVEIVNTLQTTLLIDPSADGGFENGTSFAENGWNEVHSTPDQTNRWYLGTAPSGFSGERCAYISNDSGVSWNYAFTASTVFLYRDIAFPAEETDIRLSFDYIGVGQTTSAYLRVFLVSTSTNLYPNNPPAVGNAIGYQFYNLTPEWTKAGISIPASVAGTSMRLVFMWKNAATGYNPPAAIDNIRLVSRQPVPISGSFSIDNTQPTGAGNFHDLVDAFLALNGSGVGGATTFYMESGQEWLNLPPVLTATGTEENPVVFQKTGSGENPLLKSYGTGGSTSTSGAVEGAVTLAGSDWFTFDGLDVQLAGAVETGAGVFSYPLDYGYQLYAASSTNGARHNTIQNCRVVLSRLNTLSCGIEQRYGVTPADAEGTNSYNRYLYITVEDCKDGIIIGGTNASNPDTDNEISHCTVGADTPDNIGNDTSNSSHGIYCLGQNNVVVSYNEVRNVTDPQYNATGIEFSSAKGEIRVFNNYIHDIKAARSSYILEAKGMYLHLAYPGPHDIYVYNNVITGLSCGYTGNPITNYQLYGTTGIQMLGSSGTYHIDFNSIRVDGQSNAYSAGIYVDNTYNGNSWDGINLIRNNVIANYTVAQNSSKHYGIVFEDNPTLIGQPGSNCDYNVIYIDQSQGGHPIHGFTTNFPTLADWTTASGFDAHSLSGDPIYNSPSDLHIAADSGSPALENGSYFEGEISWVTEDIDGEIRPAQTPEIGADEVFAGGSLEVPDVTISYSGGNVLLEWAPVAGAASYRVECCAQPYGEYTEIASTDSTTYSEAELERRFYRVIASSE